MNLASIAQSSGVIVLALDREPRNAAARAMCAQLPPGTPAELLCDSRDDSPRLDAAEQAAWEDWPGRRVSLKQLLGEGLMAAAAWQCVAACDAVARGDAPAAVVSLVGCNQQAIGARFVATRQEDNGS